MPRKDERPKSNSAAEMVRILQAANLEIVPPKHIRMDKSDLPFFENVIAEFAKADWSQHQLEIAALLARTMCDMEQEQWKMRREGVVVKTEKGTPVINPRKTAVQMCASTIFQCRRSLALHARASGGMLENGNRRERGKQLQTEAGLILDDLIARPENSQHAH